MTTPLNYTPEIVNVMGEVTRRSQTIATLVTDLESAIRSLTGTSEGQSFVALQTAIDAWQADADQHVQTGVRFARTGDESFQAMSAVDRRGAAMFGG